MKLLTKKSLGRQKQLTSIIMKKKYSIEIKKKVTRTGEWSKCILMKENVSGAVT